MTSWTPTGGTKQELAGAWVFYNERSSATDCARNCALNCASNVQNDRNYLRAITDALETERCIANEITLNWGDGNGGVHATNSCSYDGAITTPATAPTVPRGHVFTGWSFE